jgi:hypothetical protein
MLSNCPQSCSASGADSGGAACKAMVAAGACSDAEVALTTCRASCFRERAPRPAWTAPPRDRERGALGTDARERRVVRVSAVRTNLTHDMEGNCWYWGTDGECEANANWMARSCSRSCTKLKACDATPESPECAQPFECPLERDRDDAERCARRARNGECRARSIWRGDSALLSCPYSCRVLDPPSASVSLTTLTLTLTLTTIRIRAACSTRPQPL